MDESIPERSCFSCGFLCIKSGELRKPDYVKASLEVRSKPEILEVTGMMPRFYCGINAISIDVECDIAKAEIWKTNSTALEWPILLGVIKRNRDECPSYRPNDKSKSLAEHKLDKAAEESKTAEQISNRNKQVFELLKIFWRDLVSFLFGSEWMLTVYHFISSLFRKRS